MRLILDTNVFVSGVFFSGPPFQILDAWRHGKVSLVISPDILDEYQRVGEELASKFPGVDIKPWVELLMLKALMIKAKPLAEQVCADSDDDKFLACALASRTKLISSGDKHLLDVSAYRGITALKPKAFVDMHIDRQPG